MKQLILFFSGLLLALPFLRGQASMEITLLDPAYQPIANYLVHIDNPSIGYSVHRNTDDDGKIKLFGLSTAGLYLVQAEENLLYNAQLAENIALVSGRNTSVTLVLLPKVTDVDAVLISPPPAVINALDGQVYSELRRNELLSLPVEGRDITRALFRLPNISQATGFFPEAPNVAINGANALYTSYMIDDMDNNENFLGGQRFNIPVGAVQNITALTNNFSAEYGLTANGVINITTRSGNNEGFGEVFYVTRPGPVIDAASPYAQRDLSGNQVKDGFQRHQAGFAIGGALKPDKTFYFFNAEHTTDFKDNLLNSPELGVNQTVRGNNQFSYLTAKIDHKWSELFRSSVRANFGLSNIERQGGGLEGGVAFPSTANQQQRNANSLAIKNSYTLGALIFESNYLFGQFRWNYAQPQNAGLPDVNVLGPGGNTVAVLGHPGFVFNNVENTHQFQQKMIWSKGKHTLRAGAQFRSSYFSLLGGGNPNGSYLVQLSEAQLAALAAAGKGANLLPADLPADVQVLNYSVELRPAAIANTQRILSFYAEDVISVNERLNLSAGLRYDYDNLSRGAAARGDLNNIAPRLSANYKLDGRSALRAGYGLYYDKILYAIYSDAQQFSSNGAGYRQQLEQLQRLGILPAGTDIDGITFEGNLAASAPGVAYLQGIPRDQLQGQRDLLFSNERRILNPGGYQNPYSHQFMLGLQHQVNRDLRVYADLMHNRSYNLFRLRDLNAPAPYNIDPGNVVLRSQAEADASRPVPVFSDARGFYSIANGDTLRGISRNVVMTETEGRSNYFALNLSLEKARGSDNVAYRVMYTLSSLENNTEDINFRAMDANNFDQEWGPSINDRRHMLNTFVAWYPAQRWMLSVAALLQSGQPINRVPDARVWGSTDLNGDGRSFGDAYVGNSDRHPGESRNNDQLPWSNTFDARLQYELPLGPGKLEFSADVFNMFNAVNLSGYSNNATQSNQVQPGALSSGLLIRRNAAPPRQFQFALRYVF